MTTQNLSLMQIAVEKMKWHEERQKVLAQNIANADTPGYKPQDIAPLDFKRLLESSSSKMSLSAGQATAKNQKNPYEISPSGNAVILEEQLLKMNQNYTDHRLTTTIYQKNIDMLKNAIRSQ